MNQIAVKQINQGELSAFFQAVMASAVGVFDIILVPSGVQFFNISFGATFSGQPGVVGNIIAPSGQPYILSSPIYITTSGAQIGFSNYIPSTGYQYSYSANI